METIQQQSDQKKQYHNETDRELFRLCIFFSAAHAFYLSVFLYLGALEMTIYNIFSVLFFLSLTVMLRTERLVNYSLTDFLITAEFCVHQLLAVYFTGLDLGFQYILLSLTVPFLAYAYYYSYSVHTRLRAIVGIVLFLVCYAAIYFKLVLPKYHYEGTVPFVVTAFNVAVVFFMINNEVVSVVVQMERALKNYHDKELSDSMRLADIQRRVINNIASIIEDRDTDTGLHTARTSTLVGQICHEMARNPKYARALSDKTIEHITQSASLHDIGKIKIPDAILNKPGKLTPEEFETVKLHTIYGGEIIHRVFHDIEDPAYEQVAYAIVMYHHEHWDGEGGYPHHLKGEEIPLPARIMAVADVYDALISKRVYKEAFEKNYSIGVIKEGSGTQFDPDVVAAFLRVVTSS